MENPQTSSTQPSIVPTGCCPPFDPAPYQEQEFVWRDKPFLKDHVACFFHVPLNMGRKVTRDTALIAAAHAEVDHPIMLSDEKSPWGADIYIEVSKQVPGATTGTLTGRFLSKVFEGPFRDAPQWAQRMREFVASRGEKLDKLYFGYTTCPSCAKAYGKNFVVLFAKVRD